VLRELGLIAFGPILPFGIKNDPCSELLTFPIQGLPHPSMGPTAVPLPRPWLATQVFASGRDALNDAITSASIRSCSPI
jgi:hypothetical protein